MVSWKHVATVLVGTFLPTVIAALQGQLLTWPTLVHAVLAGAVTTYGVLMTSPSDMPEAVK